MVDTDSTREYYELTAEDFRMPTSDFWLYAAKRLTKMKDINSLLEIGCGVGAEARFLET